MRVTFVVASATAFAVSACSALLDIPDPAFDPNVLLGGGDAGGAEGGGVSPGADATTADAREVTDAADSGRDVSLPDGDGVDATGGDGGPSPVVSATRGFRPNAMVAYGDDILFASELATQTFIYRVPRDGHAAPVAVAKVPAYPRGISVDADDVCFTTSGSNKVGYVGCIARTALDAGLPASDAASPVRILASSSRPGPVDPEFYRIASNGTSVYWTDSYADGFLHHVDKTGGTPASNCIATDRDPLVPTTNHKFSDIRFVGADLFVAGSISGVFKIPRGACSTTVELLHTTNAFAFAIAEPTASPVHVVWTDYLPNGNGTVRSSLVGDGGDEPLRGGQEGARDIVIDGVNVYWVLAGPFDAANPNGPRRSGSVVTCDYRNCQPRTLATGLVEAKTLLSIGDSVFVAETGSSSNGASNGDGAILRIRKVP